MNIKLNKLKAMSIYKIHSKHEGWNGVIFLLLYHDKRRYKINIIDVIDYSYLGPGIGKNNVDINSHLDDISTFEFLGTKETNPEYFL